MAVAGTLELPVGHRRPADHKMTPFKLMFLSLMNRQYTLRPGISPLECWRRARLSWDSQVIPIFGLAAVWLSRSLGLSLQTSRHAFTGLGWFAIFALGIGTWRGFHWLFATFQNSSPADVNRWLVPSPSYWLRAFRILAWGLIVILVWALWGAQLS